MPSWFAIGVPVRQCPRQIEARKGKAGTFGLLFAVEKLSIYSRDLNHVACLGGQTKTPDALGSQCGRRWAEDLNLIGKGLHAIDSEELLVVERIGRETIGILFAGELARILMKAVDPRMITPSRECERQPSKREDLKLRFGAFLGHGADRRK